MKWDEVDEFGILLPKSQARYRIYESANESVADEFIPSDSRGIYESEQSRPLLARGEVAVTLKGVDKFGEKV